MTRSARRAVAAFAALDPARRARSGVPAGTALALVRRAGRGITAGATRALVRRARRAILAAAVLGALTAARPAAAHPLDLGYLRITAGGDAVTVQLDLHVHAAARLVGAEPVGFDAAALARRGDALADATLRGAPILTAAGACRWGAASTALRDTTASLTVEAICPAAPGAIRWAFPFVRDARVSPAFQLLVKARLGGDDRAAIVDRSRPVLELAATAAAPGFAAFVATGVAHIGAAPAEWHGAAGWKLPDGIDHIAFLVALMLAGGTLVRLLGVVSGFTLGHSITLALAALHVVRPPPRLIEPLIALSISVVAAEAFAGRFAGHRWKVAACFGLVHGFGFAAALGQLALPTRDLIPALFGYNLGVELGQIAIVIVAAPVILHLQRDRRHHGIVRGLAAAIFIAGIYWFFQRL